MQPIQETKLSDCLDSFAFKPRRQALGPLSKGVTFLLNRMSTVARHTYICTLSFFCKGKHYTSKRYIVRMHALNLKEN